MRIVIAPDSFKGTVSAQEAADLIGSGIRQAVSGTDCANNLEIIAIAMADGGEGTAAAFHGEQITLPTTDANGRLTEASYVYDDATHTAFIDVAAASGLPQVIDDLRPLTADTFGTGVLIADAQTRGATRITLGLGGSATTDGGTGILAALGASPLSATGYALQPGGAALRDLDSIDTAQLNIPAAAMEWVLLADVVNPATGPTGSAATFGPQKGASSEDIAALDAGISRLCEVCEIDPTTPGMGAAGALAVGITWLSTLMHGTSSHVHLLPGAAVVAEATGLAEYIADADCVITGEGRLDSQSLSGKVVGEVLKLTHGTPVIVVTGQSLISPPAQATVLELIDADPQAQFIDAGHRIAALLNVSQ
ncbi:glycerate kinase [Corynebacterium mustelae]|uniref:Glycerate kinase n=1 Tax=Corynebacterium mustelae TaxID=571915 RepID=A0A0G3H5F6_9CORY|nr:glycerate kinase [Corynebacterium mustelae]AKK06367.1 glycerate kinase [Corynebacterium mustelae]